MPALAGELRERIAFERRGAASDGYGNEVTAFAEQFVVWARVKPLTGGEGVQAARLTGTQPVLITVRASSQTRQIRTDWRARDARTGTLYNIKTATLDEARAFVDCLAVAGEAA